MSEDRALQEQRVRAPREALEFVGEQFAVTSTVRTLQSMMNEVTKKELNADTVNAACNCVSQLNNTIKTAIAAAKFLSGK